MGSLYAAHQGRDASKKMSLSAKGVPAGKKILREDPRQQKVLESEMRKRPYRDGHAEETRSLMLSKLAKKVSHTCESFLPIMLTIGS
jgi:hypothetical protein